MSFAETSSWQIRVDSPQGLLIGLFVRDAAGMRLGAEPGSEAGVDVGADAGVETVEIEVDVPPLVPTVEIRAALAPLAVAEASVQWARWWNRELSQVGSPVRGFCSPDAEFGDGAELGALTRQCYEDAVRWSAERHREHADTMIDGGRLDAEGDIVRGIEHELGRKARPFELTVTELPVVGVSGWRVSPKHVVVSRALRNDPGAYRQWLTPVIRSVA